LRGEIVTAKGPQGTLYGLGVGPGDPELLTLKAHRILQSAPVIAYLAPNDSDPVARRIVAGYIPEGRTEIAMRTPMVAESREPAAGVYDHFAPVIAGHLDDGRDVAVLCQGDPFFYGSFMYFFVRLAPDHRVEIVPGVSSVGAAAAAAGMPMAQRSDVLSVIPATLDEDELARRLAGCESAVILKVGRHLAKVKRVLRAAGLFEGAAYAARVGWPDERVVPLGETQDDENPYFANVLVQRNGVKP
jgi:precorrin-2/cobalt-factor-2 C20-methyltransferase